MTEPRAKQKIEPKSDQAAAVDTASDDEPSQAFARLTIEDRRALALRNSGFATWAWDPRSGLVDADKGIRDLFDLPPHGELKAAEIFGRIHIDDRPRVFEATNATIADGMAYDEQFRVQSADGSVRWLRGIGAVHEYASDGTAAVIIGINLDITDTIETEERLIAVVGEMRHRIKNSLAMVNSLAAATARESELIDEFVEKFRGRIDALAAAQRAIGATGDTHLVDLKTAVEGAMAPFLATADWDRRITMDIDEADIAPSLGQALALTIYELATNAIKYGALLYDNGAIQLHCTLDQSADLLTVNWVEVHNGDQIDVPAESSGFGTKLIDRLLDAEGGRIERTSTDDGYRVQLTFPMSSI